MNFIHLYFALRAVVHRRCCLLKCKVLLNGVKESALLFIRNLRLINYAKTVIEPNRNVGERAVFFSLHTFRGGSIAFFQLLKVQFSYYERSVPLFLLGTAFNRKIIELLEYHLQPISFPADIKKLITNFTVNCRRYFNRFNKYLPSQQLPLWLGIEFL